MATPSGPATKRRWGTPHAISLALGVVGAALSLALVSVAHATQDGSFAALAILVSFLATAASPHPGLAFGAFALGAGARVLAAGPENLVWLVAVAAAALLALGWRSTWAAGSRGARGDEA